MKKQNLYNLKKQIDNKIFKLNILCHNNNKQ